MIRHFGNLDLEDTTTDNVIYTSIFNRTLISYPTSFAMPLAYGVTVLFFVVVGVGLARRRLGLADVVVGIVACFVGIFTAFLAVSVRLDGSSREPCADGNTPSVRFQRRLDFDS